MVSNFERILEEITKHASDVSEDFDAETLIGLSMKLVDEEDKHRTKKVNINQIFANLIEQAANAEGPR